MGKLLLIICFLLFTSHAGAKSNLSDTEIVQQIIRDSIASYPGNCPCSYNAKRNGSSCGRRSAQLR
jgi:hypothetical protein